MCIIRHQTFNIIFMALDKKFLQEQLKEHGIAIAAGMLGALFVVLVLAGVTVGLVLKTSVGERLQDWVNSLIDRSVTRHNLVDSAGNRSDVIDVVDAANGAVVSIVISKDVPKMGYGFGFPGQPQYIQNGTEKKETGGGSGFLISADGYIVTNAHVVSDPTAEYVVYLNNEKQYTATVVSSDATLDVALIKINGESLPFLEFGDSDKIQVGQSVVAIGNALGQFRNTVSVGVISGLSRSIIAGNQAGWEHLSDVLQTDAAINPGSSGGPLLDLSGKVIGVNVATSSGGDNISFSLPSNMVQKAVESIKENGYVVSTYLGVRYVMIDDALAKANNLMVSQGVLVQRGDDGKSLAVIPGSPADKAGIEENDIIIKIDDVTLGDTHPLNVVLRKYNVGDSISVTLLHDGQEKTVTVKLAERPVDATAPSTAPKK